LNSVRSGSTRSNSRLDHVGVESALHEVARVFELGGLLLEHPDELGADDLALGLGLGDARQAVEEALLGVDGHQRHLEGVAERLDHLLALVLTHEAVVDEHARELVAHGSVHQQGGHRGIDAAGEAADDLAVPHLLADAADLLLGHRGSVPGHVTATDVLEEVGEDLGAVGRVRHLGVELDAVQAAIDVLERGDRRPGGRGESGRARVGLVDGVAVAHPAALLGGQSGQQAPGLGHRELRAAELADLGALDPSTEVEHHGLHPVTDAEHGDAELQQLVVEARRAVGVHRCGPAGEDQPLRPPGLDLLDADVVGEELAEHPALAHPTGDQL
jgi:hypothetical protein